MMLYEYADTKLVMKFKSLNINLPEFSDATSRMLSGSFVGDDDELDLVALLQDLAAFDLAHVEEQLLALVNLVTQEPELT